VASTTPTPLRPFTGQVEQPASPAWTQTGRALDTFRAAMSAIAHTTDGKNFTRLANDPDYAGFWDDGYAVGASDGVETGCKTWADDYAMVLTTVAEALGQIAADPHLGALFVAAGVDELLVRTVFPSRPPIWKNPHWAELRAVLGGPESVGGRAVTADDEPKTIEEEAADLIDVGAYADAMQRVPEHLLGSRILGEIDFSMAQCIAALQAATSDLMPGLLALNCRPYDQGYYAGSWVGEAVINTIRRVLEALAVGMASDPLATLPSAWPVDLLVTVVQVAEMELIDD
jgi:hypothetical protein